MWLRHGDFIALFQAWKAFNNLLRDEWIRYWTFRPQLWVFHVILVLQLCRKPAHNVQIPRDFRPSTDGPVECCAGFSRLNRQVSICSPRSDKQQIVRFARALSWRHKLGHSLKDFLLFANVTQQDLTARCDTIWALYLLLLVTQVPDRQYVTWLMPQTV